MYNIKFNFRMSLKKRHFNKWALLAAIFFLSLSSFVGKAEVMENYYVSPAGNDANPGTEEKPFNTIQKARDFIRLRQGIWSGDICVWLKGGNYYLKSTLSFNEVDSGKYGYSIIYKAVAGEIPILSGGINITNWTAYSGGIYRAECPANITGFRQLYVNGKKAVRARTPNKDLFNRLVQWRTSTKSIRVNMGDWTDGWQNSSNGKIEIIVQQYWAESIMRIVSVATSGSYKDLTPNHEEGDIVFGRDWPQKSPEQSYHFENNLDFVDQEGEWFLDDSTTPSYVYYLPRSGENMSKSQVVAPTVETLVSIDGSTNATHVNNLKFEGIRFEHSNWTRPGSNGNIGLQQQQYSIGNDQCERPRAGVFVKNADHIVFRRCVFRNMGSTGLDIYTSTNDITIEGNVFHTIAGNGIQVGKFSEKGTRVATTYNPSDTREYCENVIIANNYIHDVAQNYYCACGISAGYVRYLSILHNEVANLPYSGISVGWGWTKIPCAMTNNTISSNRIYNVMNLLCDGAGIYTLGFSPNSVMKDNFISDMVKSSWATSFYSTTYPVACIYLDQGSKGYTIEQNVLRNVHNNNYIYEGMNTHGDNVLATNYRNESNIEANAGIEPSFQDIKVEDIYSLSNQVGSKSIVFECKVYPTVITNELDMEITMNNPSMLKISVFNLGGSKIRQFEVACIGMVRTALKLDVGTLPDGPYFYLVQANLIKTVSGKFIVQN